MAKLLTRSAGGRLEAVRAFVNTRDIEAGTDAWGDAASLGDHLVRWDLISANSAVRPSDVRAARGLRESLRLLMLANNEPDIDTVVATDVVNALADQAKLRPTLTPHRRVNYLVSRADGIGALGAVISIAYDAMGDGTWARLKVCAADECRWAFYDASRNQRSRWCHMELCGNRAKGKAFRSRERPRTLNAPAPARS